jgi:hypothetical protein
MPLFVFSQTTMSRGQCFCAALSLLNSWSDPILTGALAVVLCFEADAIAGEKSNTAPIMAAPIIFQHRSTRLRHGRLRGVIGRTYVPFGCLRKHFADLQWPVRNVVAPR